jgi:hypothetical protein
MSDIETYLGQLRSHLTDLDAKRADEIVAEVRTHIESRAAQLRAGGMGEDEAEVEAARTFGDPALVADGLKQGNQHHRRPVALRAVGALVIAFGSILALAWLIGVAGALSRTGTITLPTGLDSESTTRIVKWVGYCCIALLTGIVGGRRFWWTAALPGLVMIGGALLALSLSPPTVRAELGISLLRTLVSGAAFTAIMASLSWLGSRLPRRRLSIAITIVCGSVVGVIWVGVLVLTVAASEGTGVGVWYYGMLVAAVMPVIVALLIAGRRDRFLSREAFIAALSGLCGLGLLFAMALALMSYDEFGSAFGHALPPLAVAGLVCVAGLLASLVYTVRTRSAAGASPVLHQNSSGPRNV